MTRYVVLVTEASASEDAEWRELARTEASSSEAAIRAAVATNAAGASKLHSFVAVPERSWQPMGAEIKPEPVVKLSKR